jgi:hypothetical protein
MDGRADFWRLMLIAATVAANLHGFDLVRGRSLDYARSSLRAAALAAPLGLLYLLRRDGGLPVGAEVAWLALPVVLLPLGLLCLPAAWLTGLPFLAWRRAGDSRLRRAAALALGAVGIAFAAAAILPALRADDLATAIRQRDPAAVQWQLDGGADPNGIVCPVFGDTVNPLVRAAAAGDPDIVRLLLDGGADANPAGAAGDGEDRFFDAPLVEAAATSRAGDGATLAITRLLVDHGAIVNDRPEPLFPTPDDATRDRGSRALYQAAINDKRLTVAFLLDRGADPNSRCDGKTALCALVASGQGDSPVAALLRATGAHD